MSLFDDILDGLFKSNRPPQRVPLGRRLIQPGKGTVRRKFIPLWQERQWRRKGNELVGYYRTPFGAYEGKIIEHYSGFSSFFIINPPSCLWNHSHHKCFIRKGENRYEIHFSTSGKTVDDGLMAIEKILCEAHQGGR